jgi:hypothetical protein
VSLYHLLRVVVDELFDAGLYDLNLGEDLVSGGRSGDWLGIAVPVVDIVADRLDQDCD